MNYSFKNDYAEGAHPKILEALSRTNLRQQAGYGLDDYSDEAKKLIQKRLRHHSEIHFVSGGTQANLTVIAALLRPHESIISAETGHIFTNEAGAIEATGHKIHAVATADGKLRPDDLQKVLDAHQNIPHQVKQKLVYISNSTEIGTIYSAGELQDLYRYCQAKKMYLFMDGARLGHALTAENNDLTLEIIAKNTDVFYLGGTKNGALIGEAIVINNEALREDFGYHLKLRGALLAKGRLLGIQFLELFRDDLYFELAKHANAQAMRIKEAFSQAGCHFLAETYTNQIFPILTQTQIEHLSLNYEFYIWKKLDDQHSAIRIITSWYTPEDIVNQFINEIKQLK